MRAIRVDHFGAPDVLKLVETQAPQAAPGEVLVRVTAAGVNPVDWAVRSGSAGDRFGSPPYIPGWDICGVIEAAGPGTGSFGPGDRVYGMPRFPAMASAYAEQVTAPAAHLAAAPARIGDTAAAGLPLAGLTALRSVDALRIGSRDVLLVHAAAGGVGSMAVQIGRARGARVIGTASERNHDYLRSLGAEPVAYGEGLVERVRALAPDGVTTVLDCVGGQLETTLAVLAEGGRHVSIADPSVTGHGGRWIWVRPDGAGLAELGYLADRGLLKVEVAQTFPLSEVAAAFDLSRTGGVRGKLVIVP